MIQPGNYCTHAIESLLAINKRMPPQSKAEINAAIDMLRQSVKFVLPDEGVLTERWGASLPSNLLLPYQIVACEYTVNKSNTTEKTFASRRRIALAVQDDDDKSIRVLSIYSQDDPMRGKYGDEFDFGWMIVPWYGRISMEDPSTTPADMSSRSGGAGGYSPPPNANGFVPIMRIGPFITQWASLHVKQDGRDKAIAEASLDLTHECAVMCSFIESLACVNVGTERIPASAKLNHKRAAKHAEPFYDYHVLTIHAGEHPRSAGTGQGSHSSPRLHLRRGHIRRLQSGKTTFVRPHYVGDPALGVRTKDYIVEKS